MNINIKEIRGAAFKKEFSAKRCSFRYHNKNKFGGNFAFEISDIQGKYLELHGYYESSGTITHLAIGPRYNAGCKINPNNIEALFSLIWAIIGHVGGE